MNRRLAVSVLLLAALAGCAKAQDAPPPTSPPASSSSAPAPVTPPPGAASGTLYYMETAERDFTNATIHAVHGDQVTETLVLKFSDAWLSANVSPDGSQVSWVAEGVGLSIAENKPGAKPRVISADADGMCAEPVWRNDGSLLYAEGDKLLLLPPGGGTAVPFATRTTCHYRFAADGSALVGGAAGTGTLVVLDKDGKNAREVTIEIPGRNVIDMSSVGAGARRACVHTVKDGEPSGDVARSLFCDTIVDLVSGKVVRDGLNGAVFLADGSMIVREKGELIHLDESGKELDRAKDRGKADWILIGRAA
ncbi:hypothetical protein Afil01_14660 [Actinorhabdospora filicis]|uniref:WD40 repeat protein n=1 Tax=Actinorhabdospora filicis TaxID=1785913 RepID=A0A9W6SJD5_9ACTN|nr:hypothetical protein [Actinorhabdospora filicis]GLZ76659.1 hypothetical protein Afil01_14660 [Actinorhabdospora filicis]